MLVNKESKILCQALVSSCDFEKLQSPTISDLTFQSSNRETAITSNCSLTLETFWRIFTTDPVLSYQLS
jgi:hypothetical protein